MPSTVSARSPYRSSARGLRWTSGLRTLNALRTVFRQAAEAIPCVPVHTGFREEFLTEISMKNFHRRPSLRWMVFVETYISVLV